MLCKGGFGMLLQVPTRREALCRMHNLTLDKQQILGRSRNGDHPCSRSISQRLLQKVSDTFIIEGAHSSRTGLSHVQPATVTRLVLLIVSHTTYTTSKITLWIATGITNVFSSIVARGERQLIDTLKAHLVACLSDCFRSMTCSTM